MIRSIGIHLPQCKEKFKKESINLGVKRKLPKAPEELAEILEMDSVPQNILEEYNEKSGKAYNEAGLMKCPNCSRTFLPDSLKSHIKACNTKHGTDHDPFTDTTKKKTSRPQGIMCYICGREYFSKSIEIHIGNCKKKWIHDEGLKPKKERRKMPEPPKNFDDICCGKITQDSKDEYNDEAFKEYNEKALIPCELCGRTFLPDSLKRHAKTCKGDAKRLAAYKASVADGSTGASSTEEGKVGGGSGAKLTKASSSSKPKKAVPGVGPAGVMCYICGRKYGTTSIDIHLPQCEKAWDDQEAKKPKAERRP